MLSERKQAEELIKKSENILIVAPRDENKDAPANALALFLYLKKMGKSADLIIEGLNVKKDLSFLPGFAEIKDAADGLQNLIVSLDISRTKVDQVKYVVEDGRLDFIITPKEGVFTGQEVTSCACGYKYDLIIAVGTPDLQSLGRIFEDNPDFFYKTPLINIDNDSDNESFGQINLAELTAVSLAEILFPFFKSLDQALIDEDIATCLLAGMIAGTRNFRIRTITPRALETVSDLITFGARKDEIINHLFRSRSFNVLKLWGRVLARLESSLNDRLIWSMLSQSDFLKTGSTESDLDEVIEEMITSVPAAKVIALIFENEEGKTRVWVHTVKSLNSMEFAASFNPAGGRTLVKFDLNEPLSSGKKLIIGRLEEKLKAILEKE
ncbi:MAG: hypothetical protein WCW25_01335 [Patescibacteria group bacterium]|jgi:nanoRNase/pAp phosphatase (c-di-AMP/oligoRNAs hydrolase)